MTFIIPSYHISSRQNFERGHVHSGLGHVHFNLGHVQISLGHVYFDVVYFAYFHISNGKAIEIKRKAIYNIN